MRDAAPWGLILFKRNVEDRVQLRALTDRFRHLTGRSDAPVLIDQEGGRVQRLTMPHWPVYPAASRLSAATPDPARQTLLAFLVARLIAHDLAEVGVTVDCAPVLDVPAEGSNPIVGDRAYGVDVETVARLGRAAAEGLMAGGVMPVIKHVPGHGRARVDSHLDLPVVDAAPRALMATDFAPFAANADLPAAMTAHVVFSAFDAAHPATLSAKVIAEVVRGAIGFDGLLMSDDLSMKALKGSFRDRASGVFAAGVDIALHCNGDLAETREVAAVAPRLAGKALNRAENALARIAGGARPFDPVDARDKLRSGLAVVA